MANEQTRFWGRVSLVMHPVSQPPRRGSAGVTGCLGLAATGEKYMERIMRSAPMLAVAMLLALFVGCASTESSSGTGEYIDDTVITTKVKAAIFNETTLKSAEVNVETYKGVVQLSGFVNSQDDIDTAVRLARGVKGVKSVSNSMELK
ncbi:BON domain-containing protein [Marinobacter sp. ATCH36]|uniref:BON domain-containing protein n=1 Tax=Marinobacter sp. ATCH36 TaxID=2945106 RepID=UPI0020218788|nr:BON domain-containing protein [Marinobacter sp. ATCH36]MCL7945411.1 BON domain-containing protein [Marinobacter sp. ATCH36]